MIVVKKFGGSSVGTPERMKRVAKRIAETYEEGNQVVAVVSAMGDTTDDLISLSQKVCAIPSAREMDMLLATGEQASSALLAMTLMEMGFDAISLTGWQAGYQTNGTFSKARITSIDNHRVHKELNKGNIVIVAGFQGIDEDNEINTLGRGGSDTSAVAMAVALKADVCEIYTDVDGVYTADPRLVKKAWKMAEISYDEMLEMAAMGALVLQPRSVELAKLYNVKLHVRSSFNYSEGTIVKEDGNMNQDLEKELMVCGVAHDMNVLKTTIFGVPDEPGIASDIFSKLATENINVDMIVQGGTPDQRQDISFTCGRDEKNKVESLIEDIVATMDAESYTILDNVAKVSVVGAGMISHSGVAATMFKVLSDIGININMISTSEIKISCLIEEVLVNDAVLALHTAFGLDA